MKNPEKKLPEAPHANPFEEFDDIEAYNKTLKHVMDRADEILSRDPRTFSDAERAKMRTEIPVLVRTLRQCMKVQLDQNGTIAKMDIADGSYDNAPIDEKLRLQLSALRNMSTDLNQAWGTKTVRKLTGAIREDLPNWYGVRWRQFKDTLKNGLLGAAVIGGLTVGGLVTGYAIYAGSLAGGLGLLTEHAGVFGTAVTSTFSSVRAAIAESFATHWPKLAEFGNSVGTRVGGYMTSIGEFLGIGTTGVAGNSLLSRLRKFISRSFDGGKKEDPQEE